MTEPPLARLTQIGEMTVGVLEVEGDGGHRLRSTAADLCDVEFDPIWEVDADAMLSPVAGLRIGRAVDSSTPGIAMRAVLRSIFTSNSMRLKSGGCTVLDIVR